MMHIEDKLLCEQIAESGKRHNREQNRVKDFEIASSALLSFYHALPTVSIQFCWCFGLEKC